MRHSEHQPKQYNKCWPNKKYELEGMLKLLRTEASSVYGYYYDEEIIMAPGMFSG